VDRLLIGPLEPDPLDQHQRSVNPVLRQAVAAVSRIRERYFEHSMGALTRSSEEVARTRRLLVLIALGALSVAVAVALRLARAVIGPLRLLTQGANAIREGNFEARIAYAPGDEIGEVAAAFNHMAERLAEFRRVNLEEILRAKGALEATLTALPDAVVLLGPDERIVSMNQAAKALLQELGAGQAERAEDRIRAGVAPTGLRDVLAARTDPSGGVNLTAALRCLVRGEVRCLLPRIARPRASRTAAAARCWCSPT
jgi:NtrC-family two-component system sensor histidine kinase KinB